MICNGCFVTSSVDSLSTGCSVGQHKTTADTSVSEENDQYKYNDPYTKHHTSCDVTIAEVHITMMLIWYDDRAAQAI